MVGQISSNVTNIRTKIRRLTASNELELPGDEIDEYINTVYSQDLPADIKSDLFKQVVEVFTKPNVDRYALSGTLADNTGPNSYEAIRDPVYVEGARASFYKSRDQFYNDWPRTKTYNSSLEGDGASTSFSLALGQPVLQNEVTLGYAAGASYLNLEDDGDPSGTGTGQLTLVGSATSLGTVVYSTGAITLSLSTPPDATIDLWYYTYSAGRPTAVMWWKNELVVRPVPDAGYKIEVEAYMYPTQFSGDNDTPELKQWWQYLALLSSLHILGDRQDMEGVANLTPLVERQERLVRNRRANEEIGQANQTIYNSSINPGFRPFGYGAY